MPIFQGYKSQTASRNLFTFVRVSGKTPKEAQTSRRKSKNTHEPTTNKIPALLWKDAPTTPGTLPRHKYRQTKFCATRFRFLWFWFCFCFCNFFLFGPWKRKIFSRGGGGKRPRMLSAACLERDNSVLGWWGLPLLVDWVHPPGKDLCRPERCVRVLKLPVSGRQWEKIYEPDRKPFYKAESASPFSAPTRLCGWHN